MAPLLYTKRFPLRQVFSPVRELALPNQPGAPHSMLIDQSRAHGIYGTKYVRMVQGQFECSCPAHAMTCQSARFGRGDGFEMSVHMINKLACDVIFPVPGQRIIAVPA